MKNIICFTEVCKEFPYGTFYYKIEVSKVIFRTEKIVISKKATKSLDLALVVTPEKDGFEFILDEESKDIQVGDSVILYPSVPPKIVEIIKRKKREE